MEFIRWTILSWERPLFRGGLIVPIFFLNLLLLLVGFGLAHLAVGIVFLTLTVSFWGLVAYVYISREVKEFYTEFERQRQNKPKTD